MGSKKKWYVAASINNFNRYTYLSSEKSAIQLCKNLQKIFPKRIMFWVDFNWESSIKKNPGNILHGKDYIETDRIVKDVGEYVKNYMVCSLN